MAKEIQHCEVQYWSSDFCWNPTAEYDGYLTVTKGWLGCDSSGKEDTQASQIFAGLDLRVEDC